MAGSREHVVTKTGKFRGVALLGNLGDAYEALEECFGMIWLLAGQIAHRDDADPGMPPVTREEILGVISYASAHHKEGLDTGGRARGRQ